MIRALPIAAILFATNALVQAQDLDNGRTEFLSKCAGATVPMARARAR